MMERPILFNSAMVNAILAGRKTQTRRMMKHQPVMCDFGGGLSRLAVTQPNLIEGYEAVSLDALPGMLGVLCCPYGNPGDRLWVKEAVALERVWDDGTETSIFVADGTRTKADAWPWKRNNLPGMFMPRGLRRIELEVVDRWPERLQDISEKDARAEGCEPWAHGHGPITQNDEQGLHHDRMYRNGFEVLWDSINAKRVPWSSNQFVWRVEFKVVTP